MNTDAVIPVKSLRKSDVDLEAVKGIAFEVHAGEVFGLLGPNGAGKTRPAGGAALETKAVQLGRT